MSAEPACAVAFPVGRSMRPLIYGGQAVWYRPRRDEAHRAVAPGDIVLVPGLMRTLMHRVIEIRAGDAHGAPTRVLTKGDPLLIAEWTPLDQVEGRVVEVEWLNGAALSVERGVSGLLCRSLARLTLAMYTLECPPARRPVETPTSEHCRFGGRLYTFVFAIARPMFRLAFGLAARLPGARRPAVDRAQDDWRFLRAWLREGGRQVAPTTESHVAALLDHAIAGLGPGQPPAGNPLLQALAEQKTRQLVHAMQAEAQLVELLAESRASGVELVPLKGLSLACRVYADDPSERAIGDIDVLVISGDEAQLRDALARVGAAGVKRSGTKRKLEVFMGPLRLPLDVHFDLVVKKFLCETVTLQAPAAAGRLVNVTVNGTPMTLLDPVDEWLYLAMHWVAHHRAAGLKWASDLWRCLEGFTSADWDTLVARADASGLARTTTAAILGVERVFGPLPAACAGRPRRTLGPVAALWMREALEPRRQVRQTFEHHHRDPIKHVEEIFWEFLFIDRTPDRLRAIGRLFIPSPALLGSIYGRLPVWAYPVLLPLHAGVTLVALGVFAMDTGIRSLRRLGRTEEPNVDTL